MEADNRASQKREKEEHMSTSPNPTAAGSVAPTAVPPRVAYAVAARRHMTDAEELFKANRLANAGQLYGFVAECGLKALLIASGVAPSTDGGIPMAHPAKPNKTHPLRTHMPKLSAGISTHGQLIPDGQRAQAYMATMPSIGHFNDWSIDHRYWHDAALPLTSVASWRTAAIEVGKMLDQAKQDGVL